jgi:hypothetical protein
VPLAAGFGFGAGGTLRVEAGVPALVCPSGFPAFAVGGIALAAIFSLRAFCVQSGQVTSLAFADWNHLPQVIHFILVLLMRNLPCTTKNDKCRNALTSITGFRFPSIVFAYKHVLVYNCQYDRKHPLALCAKNTSAATGMKAALILRLLLSQRERS